MNLSRSSAFLILSSALLLLGVSASATQETSPIVPVWMDVNWGANVRSLPRRNSHLKARIDSGATILVTRTDSKSGCPAHWYTRKSGGFICGSELRPSEQAGSRPGIGSEPDIRNGLSAYRVEKGGAKLYLSGRQVDSHRLFKLLFSGSVLSVRNTLVRYGTPYLLTRQKMLAVATNTRLLPPPIAKLGTKVEQRAPTPVGIVISSKVEVLDRPGGDGNVLRQLDRWRWLTTPDGVPLRETDGWVALPDGGFIRDVDIARFREVPKKPKIAGAEKWISVDLQEQMLVAWEGDRPVRMVPCSTGLKDNTPKGEYRIQWKRRLQTMNARNGHERVEDVQFVMYYLKRRGLAIHAAYWHDQFGSPVSHGCVNLPTDDARWVYDWSTPTPSSEDAENFAVVAEEGTRVITF